MKNLTFLALIVCSLFYACNDSNQAELAEVKTYQGHDIENLNTYQKLEKSIIDETADDLNALFTMYVGHAHLIGKNPKLTEQEANDFVTEYTGASFETMHEELSFNENMLAALKSTYHQMADLNSATEKWEAVNNAAQVIETKENLELVAMILGGYAQILQDVYMDEEAGSRDCLSSCRHTNIFYQGYYASYYPYLAQCGGYCYSEAAAYATDCGLFACIQFCQ